MPTSSRARAWVLYLALGIFAVSQLVGAWSDWRAASAKERSDEISRCLTGYRLEVIDGPESRALKALGDPELGQASAEYRAALKSYDVDELETLNRRARLHPEAFLRECRADNP